MTGKRMILAATAVLALAGAAACDGGTPSATQPEMRPRFESGGGFLGSGTAVDTTHTPVDGGSEGGGGFLGSGTDTGGGGFLGSGTAVDTAHTPVDGGSEGGGGFLGSGT